MLLTALPSAQAEPSSSYSEGVKAYNNRQYNQSISFLLKAATQTPNDPMVHYYMGLSYQGMNQMTMAKQQYEWVASCNTNPALAAQAQTALTNLSRYKPNLQLGSGRITAATTAATSSSTTSRGGNKSATAGQRASGRLKIIEFSTSWCGYCKKFAPIWDDVSSELRSQVDFVKLDGDDDANNAIKAKYNVTGYPRLVFTDKTGVELLNHRGGFNSPEEFKEVINQYK